MQWASVSALASVYRSAGEQLASKSSAEQMLLPSSGSPWSTAECGADKGSAKPRVVSWLHSHSDRVALQSIKRSPGRQPQSLRQMQPLKGLPSCPEPQRPPSQACWHPLEEASRVDPAPPNPTQPSLGTLQHSPYPRLKPVLWSHPPRPFGNSLPCLIVPCGLSNWRPAPGFTDHLGSGAGVAQEGFPTGDWPACEGPEEEALGQGQCEQRRWLGGPRPRGPRDRLRRSPSLARGTWSPCTGLMGEQRGQAAAMDTTQRGHVL